MQVLLSSGSPRRKELFSLLGIPFLTKVPNIPEVQFKGETARKFCSRISREKALSMARHYPEALVIGADTVVVVDGRILGKPLDENQAREYLLLLQDNTHDVFTGYTIVCGSHTKSRVIRTRVSFNPMSQEEISWYIASGEPMDKAGAYAVQGIASMFIAGIQGSYTNVIGLPVSELYEDLKRFGLTFHGTEGGGSAYEEACTDH
ncbi:MAG TPA: Maf family protein [Deltaproteobacteria bacterium]|nr:Maf family protein [Deltaproteobacteria bacterium]HPR54978.1 Maf family protein [Deltaproteobacteria bacterium]HXK46316.1 Maf family protein [Deltaproteobacteria bacterium]